MARFSRSKSADRGIQAADKADASWSASSRSADLAAAPALDLPGLRCLAASPQTLLALKVLAYRVGEDEDDVRLLAAELGLERADQVLAIAERSGGVRLDPAARELFGSSLTE